MTNVADILEGAESGHPFMDALVMVRDALKGDVPAADRLSMLVGTFHQLKHVYTSAVVQAARNNGATDARTFSQAVVACDPHEFAELRRNYAAQVRALFRDFK